MTATRTPPQAAAGAAGRVFLDTNVLVYAHDASEPRKRDLARALLLDHLGAGTLSVSTQALSEYYSVVTTRGEHRLSPAAAAWLIDQLPAGAVVAPTLHTLRAAVRRCRSSAGLSVWDALLLETAREAGADVLFTEDRRLLRAVADDPGGLRAVDPFRDGDRPREGAGAGSSEPEAG